MVEEDYCTHPLVQAQSNGLELSSSNDEMHMGCVRGIKAQRRGLQAGVVPEELCID